MNAVSDFCGQTNFLIKLDVLEASENLMLNLTSRVRPFKIVFDFKHFLAGVFLDQEEHVRQLGAKRFKNC